MLYSHHTENCFARNIGDRGLDEDVFAAALERTAAALDVIGRAYGDSSLPLLRLPEARDDLTALQPIAARWRRYFDTVVVLGTGGSSLGGQTLCSLTDIGFGPREGAPQLYFLDNIDPDTFTGLFNKTSLARTGFIVISKSGGTAETLAQFMVCRDVIGEDPAERFLIITEPGDNPLRRLAAEHGITVLDHDPGIGGRFSALSLVAMLPAMIAGLDPYAVRSGAAAVLRAALDAPGPAECAPAVGAAISISLFRDNDVTSTVLMPYIDRLADFAQWYQQLWAESLGKDGVGTTPIGALGARDQHSQLQLYLDGPTDKMFTLLTMDMAGGGGMINSPDRDLGYLNGRTMGDLLAAEQTATAKALADNGCPVRVIGIRRLDEETMGALLMHFMLETIIAAHLLGVNAFDQPAVESGKALTRRYLSEMDAGG